MEAEKWDMLKAQAAAHRQTMDQLQTQLNAAVTSMKQDQHRETELRTSLELLQSEVASLRSADSSITISSKIDQIVGVLDTMSRKQLDRTLLHEIETLCETSEPEKSRLQGQIVEFPHGLSK